MRPCTARYFSGASERMESPTLLYCRVNAASTIRAATSLGRDRLVCVVAHIFSPEGSTGISTEATGNDHGLTARTGPVPSPKRMTFNLFPLSVRRKFCQYIEHSFRDCTSGHKIGLDLSETHNCLRVE